MPYDIAVEGLQVGDEVMLGFFLHNYRVLSTDWQIPEIQQKYVTLDLERIRYDDRMMVTVVTKKIRLNTLIPVLSGPTYDWRVKVDARMAASDKAYAHRNSYCPHCGEEL